MTKGPVLNFGSDVTNKGLEIPKIYNGKGGHSNSPYTGARSRPWERAFATAERNIFAADRTIVNCYVVPEDLKEKSKTLAGTIGKIISAINVANKKEATLKKSIVLVENALVTIGKIERSQDAILDKDKIGLEVLHAHAKIILAETALRNIGDDPSMDKIDTVLAHADLAFELLRSAFKKDWEGVPKETMEAAITLKWRAGQAVSQSEDIASKYQGVL
jgi:hypothetical protein